MKRLLLALTILLTFTLVGCRSNYDDSYGERPLGGWDSQRNIQDEIRNQTDILLERIDELEVELESKPDLQCDLLQLVKDILDYQQEGFTYTYDDNYLFEKNPYDNGIDIFDNEDLINSYCEVLK
jgi:hypothetical protein